MADDWVDGREMERQEWNDRLNHWKGLLAEAEAERERFRQLNDELSARLILANARLRELEKLYEARVAMDKILDRAASSALLQDLNDLMAKHGMARRKTDGGTNPFPCPICQGTEWKVGTHEVVFRSGGKEYPVPDAEHSVCQNPECGYDVVLPHQSDATEKKIRALMARG